MSSLFGRVVKLAKTTFDRNNIDTLRTNFSALKLLVDQITVADLNVDQSIMTKEAFSLPEKAPCTFVDIYRSDDLSMSIFILDEEYTMPLHDHPMMYGILRAISGHIRVQSFSAIDQPPGDISPSFLSRRQPLVKIEQAKDVTTKTESATLTPTECNYHEITAVGGPAAFFDILSPPYETNIPVYGSRNCNFYRKIVKSDSKLLLLERIPVPEHYYCDTAFYYAPDFLQDKISDVHK